MAEELVPTEEETRRWILDTVKHSVHMEYFLHLFELGENDPQRPHDLVGDGNKFEWDVIRGLALQYRTPKVDFDLYIKPSLEMHRRQHHHKMWNNPHPEDIRAPVLRATPDNMMLGALDANCSLLENRGYQGGAHDYDGVREIAMKNPPHTTPWMLCLIPLMQWVERPRLEDITDIHDIPNIGLPDQIYHRITQRTSEAIGMLKTKGYDL
jgi:hypothetical protein